MRPRPFCSLDVPLLRGRLFLRCSHISVPDYSMILHVLKTGFGKGTVLSHPCNQENFFARPHRLLQALDVN